MRIPWALALSRDLDCQYKTAFVLAHKLREAMAADVKALRLGGAGKVAEIDGAYFGGYVKPSNLAVNRRDRRFTENKSGKRQVVVVVVRERQGRTIPAVFKSESAALGFIAGESGETFTRLPGSPGSRHPMRQFYA